MSGIFTEKNEGPITLSKAYICNQNSSMAVGGLVLRNSEGISLTNSVLMNNLPNQITVIGLAGGISVTNWETGKSLRTWSRKTSPTRQTLFRATPAARAFSKIAT